MPLAFGTDGVRGVANVELTPEFALSLGRAAARVLGGDRWYMGRDTRRSGPMLAAALAAGLAAEGVEVVDLGVVPTPAVALASQLGDDPAAVISASHNPFADNGIKLFAAGGRKLTDRVEAALEAELAGPARTDPPAAVGPVTADPSFVEAYVAHLAATLEGRRLEPLRVVIDCANGAASVLGPRVLRATGAQITVLHASPDGTNINAGCGSTYPESLAEAVGAIGADIGLAFDGDADRVLAVDHTGALVDGDHLLAVCALDLRARGRLAADTVVVTVMTNLGFRLSMAEHGITVVETDVGDRHVLQALASGGFTLGGEQSGHIIFPAWATTGDGILTGLQILDVVSRTGRRLRDLATGSMTQLPQVLRNVRVYDRDGLAGATRVWDEVSAVSAALGERGRVLLRPSGTEPLVRVMVEATTAAEAAAAAERLCGVVASSLGDPSASAWARPQ